MSSTRTYYERYWSADGFFPEEQLDEHLEGLYRRYVTADAACLEVGCGTGTKSGAWLSRHAGSYVGVDIAESAVAVARASGLDARVVEDAASLPFDDASFDVVCCTEVLEHLFRPDDAAREAARVLRPGGVLILTVPNVAYWRRRVDFLLAGRWHPGGDDLSVQQPWRDPHIRFFNTGALVRMLEKTGFDVVGVSGFEGGFFSDVPFLRGLRSRRLSAAYAAAARRAPGLLAHGLSAVARVPSRERAG